MMIYDHIYRYLICDVDTARSLYDVNTETEHEPELIQSKGVIGLKKFLVGKKIFVPARAWALY